MDGKLSKSGVFILILLGSIVIGVIMYYGPEYARYQVRREESNKVFVNEIKIKQFEQLIKVETMKADIRVEEAKGISSAQKIINATLTDKYLQLRAIEAQLAMAGSPSHTQIYIPTGQNGIPIVKTVDAKE